jgi:hypothetical protein
MPGIVRVIALCVLLAALPASAQQPHPHNVILFVPDGLRAVMVDPATAPAMSALRDSGVNFANPHSLFPTFTTANASAMGTGHYLGDTGNFSNTIYTGFPVASAGGSVTPFLENDAVLGEVDNHFGGNYLDEEAVLKAARDAGFSTAAIGKLGPVLIFDHTARDGGTTIVIDDATGTPSGIPLSREVAEALAAAGLPGKTPERGENAKIGSATEPGTTVANVAQQKYVAAAAARVVLPLFKARGKPFVLVYWSRDPDGSQHNQGDSLGQLVPGINGPTSLAGIRNADDNLGQLRQALAELGMAETTNIIVAADHGFSTISKESATSPAAQVEYADVPHGKLPPGFVALDLAAALDLPVWEPDAKNAQIERGQHAKWGNGLIGANPDAPEVVVTANGGSDLLYLPKADKDLARRIVDTLLAQDYVSGLFVDEALGGFAGTLPLSAVNLAGQAITPRPAIVVNFRSFDTGCGEPVRCAVAVADTRLQQGQGMHGSFSRADTMNFMAAIGPDFKSRFVDPAPVSNADIGKTISHILRLSPPDKGRLVGRVIEEAMPGGTLPAHEFDTVVSDPASGGLRTVLELQRVGDTRYFDAAGFPGRTVGLAGAPDAAPAAGAVREPVATPAVSR